MVKNRGCWLLATTLFLVTSTQADENPAIGYVKKVEGNAQVLVAGQSIKTEPGTPVQLGNVLKTGNNGALGVTFKDNTIMSLGPDTELVIDEYLYSPSQGNLKLSSSLQTGSLNYVSGVIAKLKPEAVSVKTPIGMIGIRGTHFLVTVD